MHLIQLSDMIAASIRECFLDHSEFTIELYSQDYIDTQDSNYPEWIVINYNVLQVYNHGILRYEYNLATGESKSLFEPYLVNESKLARELRTLLNYKIDVDHSFVKQMENDLKKWNIVWMT